MAEIGNPHDSFFKEAFSYHDAVSDFVRFYLPEDVAAQINISSITPIFKKIKMRFIC